MATTSPISGGSTSRGIGEFRSRDRCVLALEASRSITSGDVIDVVMNLFCTRGVPDHIRSDNGSEFIAEALRKWLGGTPVETLYVAAGLRGKTDMRRRFTADYATSF